MALYHDILTMFYSIPVSSAGKAVLNEETGELISKHCNSRPVLSDLGSTTHVPRISSSALLQVTGICAHAHIRTHKRTPTHSPTRTHTTNIAHTHTHTRYIHDGHDTYEQHASHTCACTNITQSHTGTY